MVTILKTMELSKIYSVGPATVRAIDQVSMSVQAGELVAVVGPSGSGKTTLLALVAALLNPTSGSIQIDGMDLGSMSERERVDFRRRTIGFTFQTNNLIPYLTALENVELMLRLDNRLDSSGRALAKHLLAQLGLENRLDYYPAQLSGGQQQRVAIARALVHDPRLVLADEPTANLDTERAFQVIETLAQLIHKGQRAGIMVTHDLRLTSLADKVISMVDGKIEQMVDSSNLIEELDGRQVGLPLSWGSFAA